MNQKPTSCAFMDMCAWLNNNNGGNPLMGVDEEIATGFTAYFGKRFPKLFAVAKEHTAIAYEYFLEEDGCIVFLLNQHPQYRIPQQLLYTANPSPQKLTADIAIRLSVLYPELATPAPLFSYIDKLASHLKNVFSYHPSKTAA